MRNTTGMLRSRARFFAQRTAIVTSYMQWVYKKDGDFVEKKFLFLIQFAETPLMDGLYWDKWYNDENVTDEARGYIFYENKLLGVPRIRQLKVTNSSCVVHSDFRDDIKQCYAPYSESVEDKQAFGLLNGTA